MSKTEVVNIFAVTLYNHNYLPTLNQASEKVDIIAVSFLFLKCIE